MATTPFVCFSGDVPLAGRMHRMTEDPSEPQPGVLVTGSWLTVKEQMAGRYAAALAERGYTAFTFDFAGFGRSGGAPRQLEAPTRKIADLAAVAEYVSTLSSVRPGGIGQLAVCASAQYAVAALARGARISSLVSVAGWFHDLPSVTPVYGGPEGVALRFDRAAAALDRYLDTGEVVTVPAYGPGDDRAGMPVPLDYYGDPARGAIPAWRNEMAEMSWSHWLTFDGLSSSAAVSAPMLFVHGDECVLPDNVRAVAGRARGPVDLVWKDGTQIDFYDRSAQVDAAVEAADDHFRRTLAAA